MFKQKIDQYSISGLLQWKTMSLILFELAENVSAMSVSTSHFDFARQKCDNLAPEIWNFKT